MAFGPDGAPSGVLWVGGIRVYDSAAGPRYDGAPSANDSWPNLNLALTAGCCGRANTGKAEFAVPNSLEPLTVNEHHDSILTRPYEPEPPPGPERAPSGDRSRPSRRVRRSLRLVLLALAAAVALLGVLTAGTAVAAARTRGNDSFGVKWADWLRGHGAAPLVADFEDWYYSSHQPKKGGRPAALNPLHRSTIAASPSPAAPARRGLALTPPRRVTPVVEPSLPGEGVWQPIGPVLDGTPSMYESQFRADDTYTSQITSAVWIDPLRLHVTLIPGLTEPGGTWPHPPHVLDSELSRLVAAFNGGFRFQDAHGGFYLYGRTAVPLVKGAASFVIYADGRVDVGRWGSEVRMGPNVVAVLQNLVPMVDHGRLSPSATYEDRAVWGTTVKTSIVVPRSGIGVTADGALVYVAGPALSARTLAESLQRAGAVRAMTLDINPYWVTFNLFTHPEATDPSYVVGEKLYPQMDRPANRYLPPTDESRDFVEVSAP